MYQYSLSTYIVILIHTHSQHLARDETKQSTWAGVILGITLGQG